MLESTDLKKHALGVLSRKIWDVQTGWRRSVNEDPKLEFTKSFDVGYECMALSRDETLLLLAHGTTIVWFEMATQTIVRTIPACSSHPIERLAVDHEFVYVFSRQSKQLLLYKIQ